MASAGCPALTALEKTGQAGSQSKVALGFRPYHKDGTQKQFFALP